LRFPRPNALDRLDAALKAVKPAVVFACYGMNDGIYHPPSAERLAAYEAGLDRLVATVRAAGAEVVLITPPIFDPVPIPQRLANEATTVFGYQATYPLYNDVLKSFAEAGLRRRGPGVTVIDLHHGMRAALAERRKADPRFTFCPDGVHPDELGHLLMGRLVAQGLGLPVPDAPLEAERARIEADPLFPLVRDRRALRSEAWLGFVGYTHTATFKAPFVRAAETVAARLQREIEALAGAKP
jgi:lysophospholipase L1-like esterase